MGRHKATLSGNKGVTVSYVVKIIVCINNIKTLFIGNTLRAMVLNLFGGLKLNSANDL